MVPLQLRWFDGLQWTEHLSSPSGPAGTAPPMGAHPDSAAHWMLPTGRSWQSIVAGYLGLFSIVVVFLGPLALLFGILGLKAAKREGSHGRGRCVFGIVAGIWGTAITVLMIASG